MEIKDNVIEKYRKYEDFGIGYTPYSGIKLKGAGRGSAEGFVDIEEHHLNPNKTVHGGLIFTLADVIGGYCNLTFGDEFTATVSSNVIYMRSSRNIKRITARAEVLKHGRTYTTVETRVYDDSEALLAIVTSVYANLTEPPA